MRKVLSYDVLSNLSFALIGGAVLWQAHPIRGWIETGVYDFTPLFFMLFMVAVALSSGEYHTDDSRPAHYDVMSMYAIGMYLFLYAILGPGWWPLVAAPIIVVASRWLRMKQLDVPMENKIGGMFLAVYGIAFLFHWQEWQLLLLSVATFFIGLQVRPKHHAEWHFFAAAGLGALWTGLS